MLMGGTLAWGADAPSIISTSGCAGVEQGRRGWRLLRTLLGPEGTGFFRFFGPGPFRSRPGLPPSNLPHARAGGGLGEGPPEC
jgi:hypothetical protein